MLQHLQQDPLHAWAARIKYRNIPVFSQTVQEIAQLTASDKSSAFDLAHVVLQDAALTARVLQAANSFTANPNRYPINNVSRAVLMLGFGAMRRISLSVALLDAFLRGAHRQHIERELARCFHAATQAWAFARHRQDPDPEEVFVAALLSSIGVIAFWISDDATTFDLDSELGKPGVDKVRAEREIVGFELKQLTAKLNREWRVSGLLDSSLNGEDTNPRAQYLEYGYEIADAVQEGWHSEGFAALCGRLAEAMDLKSTTLVAMIHENAREAARLTTSYEATAVSELIPVPR
jgi:HD-like signal output (HDOD) protein